MKQFLSRNWYRFSFASAAFIFSFGFAVWAAKSNPASAKEPMPVSGTDINSNSKIVAVGKVIYAVTWNVSLGEYEVEKVATVH